MSILLSIIIGMVVLNSVALVFFYTQYLRHPKTGLEDDLSSSPSNRITPSK